MLLHRARPTDRALIVLAVGLAVLSVACCATAIVLHRVLLGEVDVPALTFADIVLGTVYPVAGAIVIGSRPRHAVGWVLLSASMIGPYLLAGTLGGWSLLVRSEPFPLTDLSIWVATWGFVPYFYVLPLVLLLFPDGYPATPRWRPIVLGVIAVATVSTLSRMISRVETDLIPQAANPAGIAGAPFLYVTLAGSFLTLFGGTLLGLISLRSRARGAVGRSRAQLQWLSLGGVTLVGTMVVSGLVGGQLEDVIFAAGLAALPLAIAVAMVRHQLFDVEFALNRTIVFTVLSAVVVALYLGIVLAAGTVAPSSPAGVLLVAVVAVAAASGRTVVQAGVDRWLFGHRRDPYAVVSTVGRHVAPASEPREALQRLVDALREALRLPYAAFHGAVTASSGDSSAGWHAEPVHALGQQVGELRAGLRRPGERFSADELAAIREVGSRAATLAYAASLVDDVAASRSRIVVAREEERRRLRADLHDGVGPALAGTAHQMDALARRMAEGPSDLHERAVEIGDRLRDVVGDVRAVTHGLRPPVLDHVGLASALRRLVDGYDVPECTATIHDELADLPAAVEVAAHAIAAEAVANAVRHSAASRVHLEAALLEGALTVSISDNGRGMPARPGDAGLGLTSMGERAVEVGGRLDVGERPGGGTVVRAHLPLEAP